MFTPNRKKPMPKKITTILAVLLCGLVALACGSGNSEDPPSGNVPGNNAADDSSQSTETDLKSTVTFSDGIAVSIKDVKRGTTSQYASPSNEAMVMFKVSITNGTSADLDLALVTVDCAVGADGDQAQTVIDPENDLDITINGVIKTGTSKSGKFGCPMSKDTTALQIEVALNDDLNRPPAVFTGKVK